MLKLIKLWSVHYQTLERGEAKALFYTYVNKDQELTLYIIKNKLMGINRKVSKLEGNDYFKEILSNYRNVKVNKIIDETLEK